MRENCGECKFYKDDAKHGQWLSGYGKCCRFPEHIKVNDGHWCGEFVQATPPEAKP